ncbi:MAG TPA: tetratricopeptide repeat protein [Gemmataceae bacterium]|nr:tetratricopeptide repeat protein [Gemmataceae bacterium]
MAKGMALPTTSPPLPDEAGRPGLRRLWQVPVFFLGVLAVLGVWVARPLWQHGHEDPIGPDLRAAHAALERPRPAVNQALALAEGLLARTDLADTQAGEAHFLAGTCYLRRAAAEADADSAAALWKTAREHLEKAEALGVPVEDRDYLLYRLARAWYQTGNDPSRVISYLTSSLEHGADDLGEAYGMLAQSYLRLPNPDVAAALEANRKQLALPTDNENVLAPARLLRGELLLRVQQRDEAQVVLGCIKKGVPPAIHARALWLRAMAYQEAEKWKEAQDLWEELLRDPDEPPREPDRVLYYLGLCYFHAGRPNDASGVWESALKFPGEGGQAAAFRLAELYLHKRNTTQAGKAYERALHDVGRGGYHNALLPVGEAQRACDDGCRFYLQSGEYDSSRKLAAMYAPLAPRGVAQELISRASDAWAQSLLERAGRARGQDAARRDEEDARLRLREAGQAYEAAADLVLDRTAQADFLWRSADRYIQGRDYRRALAALARFLRSPDLPGERLGEGWFALGMVHQSLHQEEEARAAYHQCIEVSHAGPFAYRARYQLAEAEIRRQHHDEAEEILRQNLRLMAFEPDPEAHEKSLLLLAGLLFERGEYRVAAHHLQEALYCYPANPRSTTARYVLAECYRRMADQENEHFQGTGRWIGDLQVHYADQYHHWLQMAAANYQKLKDDLLARQRKGPLPEEDEAILRKAEFAEADCRFYLGQDKYNEAIRLYEVLVGRYHHRAEGLDALAQITRCYWVKRQPEMALKALQRIRAALQEMDDTAVSASTINHSRQEWQEWLDRAIKLCVVP